MRKNPISSYGLKSCKYYFNDKTECWLISEDSLRTALCYVTLKPLSVLGGFFWQPVFLTINSTFSIQVLFFFPKPHRKQIGGQEQRGGHQYLLLSVILHAGTWKDGLHTRHFRARHWYLLCVESLSFLQKHFCLFNLNWPHLNEKSLCFNEGNKSRGRLLIELFSKNVFILCGASPCFCFFYPPHQQRQVHPAAHTYLSLQH